jgi:hypothetical protein
MYSFGSVSAVGSWFFISVTSNVRKSLAEMVDDELLVSLELLVVSAVALVLFVDVAVKVAELPARACTAVMW